MLNGFGPRFHQSAPPSRILDPGRQGVGLAHQRQDIKMGRRSETLVGAEFKKGSGFVVRASGALTESARQKKGQELPGLGRRFNDCRTTVFGRGLRRPRRLAGKDIRVSPIWNRRQLRQGCCTDRSKSSSTACALQNLCAPEQVRHRPVSCQLEEVAQVIDSAMDKFEQAPAEMIAEGKRSISSSIPLLASNAISQPVEGTLAVRETLLSVLGGEAEIYPRRVVLGRITGVESWLAASMPDIAGLHSTPSQHRPTARRGVKSADRSHRPRSGQAGKSLSDNRIDCRVVRPSLLSWPVSPADCNIELI